MHIECLETLVPSVAVPLAEVLKNTNHKQRELAGFCKLFGHSHIRRFVDCQTTANRLSVLLDRLTDGANAPIDAVVYVHALPVQEPDGTDSLSVLLRGHPALSPKASHFEIDQYHCAGGIFGLRLAERILASGFASRVALLIGDHLHRFDPDIRYVPGVTALGDAFVGLVLSKVGTGARISMIETRQSCQYPNGVFGSHDEMASFFKEHNRFVADLLLPLGHQVDDPLLAHNINLLAWRGYWGAKGERPRAVDLSLVGDFGHCFAADPFLLLTNYLTNYGFPKSDSPVNLTLLAVGLGSFSGACRVDSTTH